MKRFLWLPFLFLGFVTLAQEINLDVYRFQDGKQAYIEVYTRVLGSSLSTTAAPAAADLTIFVYENDSIITYSKVRLTDTERTGNDLLYLERFPLAVGDYAVSVIATDANLEENTEYSAFRKINIVEPSKYQIGDVQIIADVSPENPPELFLKGDAYVEPLSNGYLAEELDVLRFYTEVYVDSPDEAKTNYLKYSVVRSDEEVLKKVIRVAEIDRRGVMLTLPVDEVRTGSYKLVLELLDKDKNLLAESVAYFYRANEAYDLIYWQNYNGEPTNSFVSDFTAEDVVYSLQAIVPVVKGYRSELIDFIIRKSPLIAQKAFLLDYWTERSPENTQAEYDAYMRVARIVDKTYYSNVGRGFQTDRGYTFLRYGKPNNVLTIDQEPDAPPYEIWYYNYLAETQQTERKFLFYNPSLAEGDFQLLHSNVRGSRFNPRWEVELYDSAPMERDGISVEATKMAENWNRHARKYWDEF